MIGDREQIARLIYSWSPCWHQARTAALQATAPGGFVPATWEEVTEAIRNEVRDRADAILALDRSAASLEEVERLCKNLLGHAADLRREEWDEDNEAAALIDQAVAALARSTDVPAGYVMVPREATEAMQHAGQVVQVSAGLGTPTQVWSAMIAAAPAGRGEGRDRSRALR